MTLTFDQALVEYKHAVELCEIWNFIHMTLTFYPNSAEIITYPHTRMVIKLKWVASTLIWI